MANVFKWVSATIVALTLSGCGYNTLQTTDEDIKATWAEVLNNTSAAPTWCRTWSTW